MLDKKHLRRKFFKIRKKNYFEVQDHYFLPIMKLLRKFPKNKIIHISSYYPSNFEVNTLNFLKIIEKKRNKINLLPVIFKKRFIKFYKWKYLDILKVNRFGML